MKEKLADLEKITPGTPQYDSVLSDIMTHLRKHNDSEEREDLPLLEPSMGEDGSRQAALSFSRTKMFAPTRSAPVFCLFLVRDEINLVDMIFH